MLKSLIEKKNVEIKCYDKSYDRDVCKVFLDRKDIAGNKIYFFCSFLFFIFIFFILFLFYFIKFY